VSFSVKNNLRVRASPDSRNEQGCGRETGARPESATPTDSPPSQTEAHSRKRCFMQKFKSVCLASHVAVAISGSEQVQAADPRGESITSRNPKRGAEVSTASEGTLWNRECRRG